MEKRTLTLILILSVLILFGSAGAGTIAGLNDEYISGDTITIIITNSEESSVLATLEANEFNFNTENVNFIRSYAATSTEKDNTKTWTLKIDTTGVPLGTYNLIIKGDSKILAAEKINIICEKTDSNEIETTQEIVVEPIVKDIKPPTPANPGFSIAAILGIALIPFIRNKKK